MAVVNIYMFLPCRIWHATKFLIDEPVYFVNRVNVVVYQGFHPLSHDCAMQLFFSAWCLAHRHISQDPGGV